MDILKNFLRNFILLFFIIGIIIFLSGNDENVNSDLEIKNNNTVKAGQYIEGPKQEKIKQETITVDIGGIKVDMTKLAKYDITGVVMDTEKYSDVVGPIDVALAWGNLAKDYNYKDFTSYVVRNRTLTWSSNNSNWIEKMGGVNAINRNCSNNHLVPANSEVRKEILKIKNDEYIRLTGYLVSLEWKVGNTKHIWGPSSLSRDDSGNNACEIIYVQTVNFL